MSAATPSIEYRNKLVTLEAGRFFAALSVVLGHYTYLMRDVTGETVLHGVFGGTSGVPYFFVLSGFIIYHVHRQDLGRRETVKRFFLKRAIRLLPMFWATSLLMLVGFLLIPGLAGERSITPLGLIADFLLLPHSDAVLSISWTLRHEVVFYCLFALALVFGPKAFWLILVWIGISLIGTAWPLNQSMLGSWSIVMGALNLGFGLGLACAWALPRKLPVTPRMLIFAGAILLIALLLVEWLLILRGGLGAQSILGAPGVVAHLIAAALLILGLARLEDMGWRPAAGRFWSVAGGSSYVLYLIHQPLASAAVRVLTPLRALPAEVVFAILSVAAVVAAVIVHLFVERPLLSWLSSRMARKSAS